MRPANGAPGTTVRVRARGIAADATVRIGRRQVPAQINRRHITFTVPRMRPGKHRVVITSAGTRIAAGVFEVTGGAATTAAPRPGTAPPPAPAPGPATTQPPAATQPPVPGAPPGAPPHMGRPHRRGHGPMRGRRAERWKRFRERMMVSSYHPKRGPAGTQVTIRGRGFNPGAKVTVGGQMVKAADVKPRRITFRVPRRAKDGMIQVLQTGQPPLYVGPFDFKKKPRTRAELRKLRDERRARATKRWHEYRKALPPKPPARRAWLMQREAELRKTRADRRRARLERIRAKWQKKFLNDPQVRAEMTLHATRLARLERMKRVAAAENRDKLVVRVEILIDRENNRHSRRMSVLKTVVAAK